jgi:UDP-N-acetylmuramoyl-L-alanyl-D-glutamate--2,6-diaminopimelate ligase
VAGTARRYPHGVVTQDQLAATRPVRPPVTTVEALADWLVATGVRVETSHAPGTTVTGITLSSQRVRPGDLYAALPGARTHGAGYAAAAVEGGATAVLTDPEGAGLVPRGVPLLVLDRPRAVLGRLSARVYGDPAASLRMVAVTGTQGKTTTTRMAEGGLLDARVRAAVIGTVGTRIAGRDIPTALTTPEAPDLHGLFARMREEGVVTCAMEVSSHALVMGRVDGVRFDVAVFTNLGRDHLDFHADLEDYYRAKASLFTPERAGRGLVSVDDEHGRRLAAEAPIPVRTFSIEDREADWRAVDLELSAAGSTFTLLGPGGLRLSGGVPMPGAFNVANAVAAIAAVAEVGHDAGAVAIGIARGAGVPGRFERVDAGQDFEVIVDYAHKPDAVAAALDTLRPLARGRLIVVIGAGGDRDAGKRSIMGEIAARSADVVLVTDDNPRSEDPAGIRAAVLTGARGGTAEVLEVGDRREAIRTGVRLARAGDIVLIAGRGHETGQEIRGEVHPFDDRLVAAEELADR